MSAPKRNLEGSTPNSMIAGENITANRLLKLDTTEGQVLQTTAITSQAIGAATQTVASGDNVEFQATGVAKLEAASAISLGDQVMPDGGGGGKIATAAGATAFSVGIALQAAGGAGEIISVKLGLPSVKGPANT